MLYPDPHGGRYLWARAQTALSEDGYSKRDANGHLPAEHWPRLYNVMVEAQKEVAGSGSGGRI